jgi:hypothetical protein
VRRRYPLNTWERNDAIRRACSWSSGSSCSGPWPTVVRLAPVLTLGGRGGRSNELGRRTCCSCGRTTFKNASSRSTISVTAPFSAVSTAFVNAIRSVDNSVDKNFDGNFAEILGCTMQSADSKLLNLFSVCFANSAESFFSLFEGIVGSSSSPECSASSSSYSSSSSEYVFGLQARDESPCRTLM